MYRPAIEVSSVYTLEGLVLLRLVRAAIPAINSKAIPPIRPHSTAPLFALGALISVVLKATGSKLRLFVAVSLPPSPTMTKGAQAEG